MSETAMGRAELVDLVLALADDELLVGYRDGEWTGIAPTVEEDVALSSIAQDEVGHAYALYGLAAPLLALADVNQLVFARAPDQFRHARMLECPRGDFAFTVARRFAYELADQLRTRSLLGSSFGPLRELMGKMVREEVLHLDHALGWLECLSRREPGRSRLQSALSVVLPQARSLLAPLPGEPQLLLNGVLPASWQQLAGQWEDAVAENLSAFHLLPDSVVPSQSPALRSDRHQPATAVFNEFHAQLTSVYGLAPEQSW